MNFARTEISATRLRSLAWDGDTLVDWVGGRRYPLQGSPEEFNVGSGWYRFNAAVGFGSLGVTFEALGAKGVLLRDNGQRSTEKYSPLSVDIIREIDRSYYHANHYLFPVTLFADPSGRPILAHCPRGYNALDLEDIKGQNLTPRSVKGAEDVFHSRL